MRYQVIFASYAEELSESLPPAAKQALAAKGRHRRAARDGTAGARRGDDRSGPDPVERPHHQPGQSRRCRPDVGLRLGWAADISRDLVLEYERRVDVLIVAWAG